MLLPIAKVMRFQLKLVAFSCELTLHNNYRVFTHGNLEFLCHFGVNTVTELIELHWIYSVFQLSKVRECEVQWGAPHPTVLHTLEKGYSSH
jgi:hypothetical protein